jgi:dimethylaniline monooxygenase (N-oxide forming)
VAKQPWARSSPPRTPFATLLTPPDIAYLAIKADAASVTMCFRTGFLSFPKALSRFKVFGKQFTGGLPIDGLITNLFETAYVHRAIAASRFRWFVSDFVIKRVLWFLTGTQAGMNQHVGALPHDRLGRAFVFLNKSSKAMPYLNRPYQPKHPLAFLGNGYVDPPEDAQSKRWVDTCSFPSRIDASGRVHFEPRPDRKDYRRLQHTEVRPTCIVYCTGYTQSFPWLAASYPTASDAIVRNIVAPADPSIAFIGFVRPGVGAIPPIAEQQAMWWTALITDRMALPTDPPHYHLLAKSTSRIQYGVDHSAYMSTLARDFGGAPGLLELWRTHGVKVLLVYCFGASFVTFYRLVGPFQSTEAPRIARGELAETILRRGVLGNVFFGVSMPRSDLGGEDGKTDTDVCIGYTDAVLRTDQCGGVGIRDGRIDSGGEERCVDGYRGMSIVPYNPKCTSLSSQPSFLSSHVCRTAVLPSFSTHFSPNHHSHPPTPQIHH